MFTLITLIGFLFSAELPPGVKPYFVVFHTQGKRWSQCHANQAWERRSNDHRAYIISQMDAGKIVVAGALLDEGRLHSVGVIDVPKVEEAKAIMNADPMVRDRCLSYEIHPAVLRVDAPKL
jgi:uncharacterized protein YciI